MTKIERYRKKYNLKNDEEALALIKSQSPRFLEYWIAKGYSKEEALYQRNIRNPTSIVYWLAKGYSEEEAKFEIARKRKTSKYYWIDKGYSEEEAIKIANFEAKKRNQACKEYWLAKGYSEDEAIEMAKTNGVHFEKALAAKANKETQILCKEYWLAKGYSEEEAIEKAKEKNRITTANISFETRSKATKLVWSKISNERKETIYRKTSSTMKKKNKTHSPIFKEYWIAKGYSEKEAINMVFETKSGSLGKLQKASKIELRFFNELKEYLDKLANSLKQQKWVHINGKNYCQDGRIKNTVIEFNGTKFHLDSRFFTESDKNPVNVSYTIVKEQDSQKIMDYMSKKYNIIIVWEYDYLNYKEELFKKIKELVENESNQEGNYWDSSSFFNKR